MNECVITMILFPIPLCPFTPYHYPPVAYRVNISDGDIQVFFAQSTN